MDVRERRWKLKNEEREREKISFENRKRFDKEKYYDVIDVIDVVW